jgi:hypothetical protein
MAPLAFQPKGIWKTRDENSHRSGKNYFFTATCAILLPVVMIGCELMTVWGILLGQRGSKKYFGTAAGKVAA